MGYCRMSAKTKLELTWIGKENRPRLEPRILIEDEHYTYHATTRREGDLFDNILVRGDNLLGLKALESSHEQLIKCAFIDPPYNTGSAFEHYDDGLEHSQWLNLLRPRLDLIKNLLSDEGSIWITIDDNECHYLKVVLDEVFGRQNFVANIVWQKAYTSNQTAKHISNTHDHILVYAKNESKFVVKKVPRSEEQKSKFSNPDKDDRGPWKAENLSAGKYYSAGQFEIKGPFGDIFLPPRNRYWRCNEAVFNGWLAEGRITYGLNGRGRPMLKKFLSEMEDGLKLSSWWPHDEAGSNKEASIHLKELLGDGDVFQTPKPEKLLKRILEVATDVGDLVLDSFAGSGTTGAVAQKMNRRWIMVELGDHCETQIVPRLKKVIDGDDPGGVTEQTGWKGGGGYRYFRLAPSLLEKDQFDQWVISKAYNAQMLAEAMCKHFGFTYAPSVEHYWVHGYSSETDFIYVTTNSLTHDQLRAISDEVGDWRTLLICCKAFQGANADSFANLTIRKIPGAVLDRCEWGKDDYSLKIEALPLIEDEPEPEDEPDAGTKPRGRPRKVDDAPSLFDAESEA
jgi:adenine-specific DNA-methyltransferase